MRSACPTEMSARQRAGGVDTNIYNDSHSSGPDPCAFLIKVVLAGGIMGILLLKYSGNEKSSVTWLQQAPSMLGQIDSLQSSISGYIKEHAVLSLGIFSMGYLLLQTVAMPGCTLLNLVAGAYLGVPLGVPTVTLLLAIGTCVNYYVSLHYAHEIVAEFFSDKLSVLRPAMMRCCSDSPKLKTEDEKATPTLDSAKLLRYLVWLRVFPYTPTWFVNMAAPILGVPCTTLSVANFIGSLPYTLLTVRMGSNMEPWSADDFRFDISATINGALRGEKRLPYRPAKPLAFWVKVDYAIFGAIMMSVLVLRHWAVIQKNQGADLRTYSDFFAQGVDSKWRRVTRAGRGRE